MQRRFTTWAAVGVVLAAGAMMADVCRADAKEDKAVKAASDNFYKALNTMFTGDAGPMKDAWSHGKDVTYMGPSGGIQVGWKAIEKYWDAQAEKKLGGKVMPADVQIVVGDSLAVVTGWEKGENVVDGKAEKVAIRATTTYRKEKDGWKVIGHQTDLLSYLDGEKKETASAGTSSGGTVYRVRPTLRQRLRN